VDAFASSPPWVSLDSLNGSASTMIFTEPRTGLIRPRKVRERQVDATWSAERPRSVHPFVFSRCSTWARAPAFEARCKRTGPWHSGHRTLNWGFVTFASSACSTETRRHVPSSITSHSTVGRPTLRLGVLASSMVGLRANGASDVGFCDHTTRSRRMKPSLLDFMASLLMRLPRTRDPARRPPPRRPAWPECSGSA
jgi:hypothetical protein